MRRAPSTGGAADAASLCAPYIVTVHADALENVMERLELARRSWKARLASAAFALVASLSCVAAVVAVFASASGEVDPPLVKLEPASAGSSVAGKTRAKPARS